MSLFQSNLRKQIRKLPKIQYSEICEKHSILFNIMAVPAGRGTNEDDRAAERVPCVLPAGLRVAEGGTRVERPACSSLHVSAFSSVGVGLAWAQNKKYK